MADGTIHTEKIFDAETITKNTSTDSSAIDLQGKRPGGNFSVQVELTGTGVATIEWIGSNDNVDYIKPNGAQSIATGMLATSGPGSDGKHIYGFSPALVRYLKIRVTETGTANNVVVTITLAIQ